MKKMVAITGGTGLVGRALCTKLSESGYEILVLSRNPEKVANPIKGVTYIGWNIEQKKISPELARAEVIVHLAGVPVMAKRWTDEFKKEIVDSRVNSAELLVDFLRNNTHDVKQFVTSSAIGWYGPDNGRQPFTEDMPAHAGFLGTTCRMWEAASQPVNGLGIRWNAVRTGIVLSSNGGAFLEFYNPVKFHIAPILGSGRQSISWIHIDDLCGIYQHLIENPVEGAINGVAPLPVTNKELVLTLARQKAGSIFLPVPVPAIVLNAVLGESSIEVLKSATVSSAKIENNGFRFKFPTIGDAVRNLASG